MKKIFGGIGRFFAKIGRWIKNTAWVQPLLIVGGIFGLIFAIRPTTTWIKSWFNSGDDSTSYYKKHDLSWDKYKTSSSEVDKLFTYLQSGGEDEALKEKFGTKFFVNFVQEDCSGCDDNYTAFKYLEKYWGSYTFVFEDDEGKAIKKGEDGYEELVIYNIFCDVEKKNNDTDKTENLFNTYIIDKEGNSNTARYGDIFTNVYEDGFDTWYRQNQKLDNDYYQTKMESFESPTTFLIDFDYKDGATTNACGISEMLFTIEGKDGSNSLAKAKTLWDCWNHADQFSKNPTTK